MRSPLATLALAGALVACSAGDGDTSDPVPPVVQTSVIASPTTNAPAPTTTSPPSTSSSSSTTTTMERPPTTSVVDAGSVTSVTAADPVTTSAAADTSEEIELGRSVEGRPITAIHRGDRDGLVVLVVGDIHGDEAAGVAVVEHLATAELPDGIDLWLVHSMNPDGMAANERHNANGVDLNRNFPHGWAPMGEPGYWQYAGPSAASEPETKAMVALIDDIEPDLTLWYHQDLFRISPSTGKRGEVRARYAELTGLPLVGITGGTYTGTAGPHVQSVVPDGVAFTVELGPGRLTPRETARHAQAVLTVATELAADP